MHSATQNGVLEHCGNFELLQSFEVNSVRVLRYRSCRSGMQLCFVDAKCDIVHGYLLVATEEHGSNMNFGLPHTLEHLVFMGSQKMPYKGVLDTLANLSYACGTNAWTETDHTCYTISTVGDDGMRSILPIYLDHLLDPVLSEEAFMTEIYHVNGMGEDGGVVYAEVMGTETLQDSASYRKIVENLYPAPCGYSSDTGGMLDKIRQLTPEMIRDYHKSYYNTANLSVVIIGRVDVPVMLQEIATYDNNLPTHIINKTCTRVPGRPWFVNPVTSCTESTFETVCFPDHDESYGSVQVGFRGPNILKFQQRFMIETLLHYLTESTLSVLVREFVEIDEPLCNSIKFLERPFLETCFILEFEAVPTSSLETIAPRLIQVLSSHQIDIHVFRLILNQRMRSIFYELENNPEEFYSTVAITHFLYGDQKCLDAHEFFRIYEYFAEAASYDVSVWQELLFSILRNCKLSCAMARPSSAMVRHAALAEQERISSRFKQLGSKGIQALEKKLAAAMAHNDRNIPKEILYSYRLPRIVISEWPLVHAAIHVRQKEPDLRRLRFRDVALKRELLKCAKQFGHSRIPIAIDHVPDTNFITITTMWDIRNLPRKLIPYLEMYCELLFSCGTSAPNERRESYADIMVRLLSISVSHYARLGSSCAEMFLPGSFETQMLVSITVLPTNYEAAVDLLRSITLYLEPEMKRVMVALNKLLTEIPDVKRDPVNVCKWVSRNLFFKEDSPQRLLGLPTQTTFLNNLFPLLAHKNNVVAKNLKALKRLLFSKDNLRVHISANVADSAPNDATNDKSTRPGKNMSALMAPWVQYFEKLPCSLRPISGANLNAQEQRQNSAVYVAPNTTFVVPSRENLNKLGLNLSGIQNSVLVNVPATEGGHMSVFSAAPLGIDHPEIPALLVAIEYLTRLEGMLWRQIRGPGLAYGFEINFHASVGMITFDVYRSVRLYEVYERAKRAITKFVDPNSLEAIEDELLSTALKDVKATDSQCSIHGIVSKVLEQEQSDENTVSESSDDDSEDAEISCDSEIKLPEDKSDSERVDGDFDESWGEGIDEMDLKAVFDDDVVGFEDEETDHPSGSDVSESEMFDFEFVDDATSEYLIEDIKEKSAQDPDASSLDADLELLSAKSALIYRIVQKMDNPISKAQTSMENQFFWGLEPDHDRRMITLITGVDMDAIKRVTKKFILPLFDFEKSVIVAGIGSYRTELTLQRFKKLGIHLNVSDF